MNGSTFDRKKLTKDALNAISQFCADKTFLGYDGEQYKILSGGENTETKGFVDVAVKIAATDEFVARYALVLIGLARQLPCNRRRSKRFRGKTRPLTSTKEKSPVIHWTLGRG